MSFRKIKNGIAKRRSEIEAEADLSASISSISETVSSGNFSNIVTAPNYNVGVTNISYPNSVNLDFSSDTGLYNITANSSFSINASNYTTGAIKTIRIQTTHNIFVNFPTDFSANLTWKFVGIYKNEIPANKVAIITITCFGSNASNVVAAISMEE